MRFSALVGPSLEWWSPEGPNMHLHADFFLPWRCMQCAFECLILTLRPGAASHLRRTTTHFMEMTGAVAATTTGSSAQSCNAVK